MSKKKLTDFKPEFIKPYLSGITLEYVCALEDEVERLREAQRTAKKLIDRTAVNSATGCWEWSGHKNKGYGRMFVGSKTDNTGKQKAAHRLSYESFVGDIPEGLYVCHKCDNPGCINPNHLFLGTHQDNVDDRVSKDRNNHYYGEKDPNAKLTDTDVARARQVHAEGRSYRSLAREYGVHHNTITRAIKGKTWGHTLPAAPNDSD